MATGNGGGGGIITEHERPAAALSTPALVKELTHQAGLLVRKQIELAKAELRADLHAEATMAKGLGVAGLAALLLVQMLLVTAVLALAEVMPGWAAGLIMSGVLAGVAAVAALLAWHKRVRKPMARSRAAVEEDVRWTKERLA
jgi:hypothetical protein